MYVNINTQLRAYLYIGEKGRQCATIEPNHRKALSRCVHNWVIYF